ncbi:COG1470 family protein [Kitasatospora indigofera]|uniref:COG1470 family protein n=1 Tax=Kitasatospora indigofera TaxID=67307 RepID=UPI0033BD031C
MRRSPVVTLLLVVVTALLPVQARAADNGEWSVKPADSEITPRTAFQLSARPGATFTDRAVITNTTSGPLTFRLHVADAYNTQRDGGLAVRGRDETQRDVGAWGRPDKDVVTVPGNSSETVGFTLAVPGDASPGDHVGALVAVDDRVQPGPGTSIGVQRGVGARIYLRVEGAQRPALTVEDVRLTAHNPRIPWTGDSSSTLSYTLHNTGNVKLDPRASARLGGVFAGGPTSRQLANVPAELLPGEKVQVTETWPGAPSGWGEVTVTATANGVGATGSDGFLEVPWFLVGLLALLTAGCAVPWVRRRRAPGRP